MSNIFSDNTESIRAKLHNVYIHICVNAMYLLLFVIGWILVPTKICRSQQKVTSTIKTVDCV